MGLSRDDWDLRAYPTLSGLFVRNGRNAVSRTLFRKSELTEFCGKLGQFALANKL